MLPRVFSEAYYLDLAVLGLYEAMCGLPVPHLQNALAVAAIFVLEHWALNMVSVNRVGTLCVSFVLPLNIKVQFIASLVIFPEETGTAVSSETRTDWPAKVTAGYALGAIWPCQWLQGTMLCD